MNRPVWQAALVLALIAGACARQPVAEVNGDDLERMKQASRAYMEAWLSNDEQAVMATLVPEPVLSPSAGPSWKGSRRLATTGGPKAHPRRP
jgi:hypothetical protein